MQAAWVTLPNLITALRLLLAPVVLALLLSGAPRWALACFTAAMVSDVLDGLLARLLDQRSHIGAILDPIADKAVLFAALVPLVFAHQLPLWLLALVLFRDGAMVLGAILVRRKHLALPGAPTRIGKYATFMLSCLIAFALFNSDLEAPGLGPYTAAVGFIAALCVGVSTAQYFVRFGYLLFAPARSAHLPPKATTSSD